MRATRRRALALSAATVAVAVALSGCSGSGAAKTGQDRTLLTLGMTSDINGWDPQTQAPYQIWPIEAVYDRVVKCNAKGELQPAIATSWKISDDRRSFTAKLRSGDEFTDGTPVDAEAVKANFEPLIKSASDRYGGLTFSIADAHTITLTWPEPQPLMNTRMCDPWVGSAKYLASGKRNTEPVGSGPYKLDPKTTTNGSIYSFVRNPGYYDAKSYPYDKVQVRVLDSGTAGLNALRTGQIDGTIILPSAYDQAKKAGLQVSKSASGAIQFVLADHDGKKIPALGDVRVRRAINMALDKQAIADKLFDGLATPVDQIYRKGNAAYIDDLKDPYPFDIAKAKKLMAEAGYEKGFELTLPTMAGQPVLAIFPYVTQQLAKLNITVKQKALTGPSAINDLLSGDFPAPLFDLTTASDSILTTTISVLPTGYWNVEHQPDAKVDALWKTISTGDATESAAAEQELNRYIIDQAWFAPLVSVQNLYAYSDEVSIPKITDPNGFHPLLRDFK